MIVGITMMISVASGVAFSAHIEKQPDTSAVTKKRPVESSTVVVSEAAPKSLWSSSAFLETDRAVTGRPASGFNHLMFLEVGRVIPETTISDLKLAFRLYGQHAFKEDRKKDSVRTNYKVLEPTLLLSKGNLFEIAGIKASAQTRFYAPLNPEARLTKRNPHSGNWRQVLSLEKAIGKWTLGSTNFIQYYGFRNDWNQLKAGTPNDIWRLANDISAGYQIMNGLILKTGLEFEHRWKRATGETGRTSSGVDWANTAEFSPLKNLTVETGLILSAPNQALSKYFGSSQSRAENTTARLDLSYKFL